MSTAHCVLPCCCPNPCVCVRVVVVKNYTARLFCFCCSCCAPLSFALLLLVYTLIRIFNFATTAFLFVAQLLVSCRYTSCSQTPNPLVFYQNSYVGARLRCSYINFTFLPLCESLESAAACSVAEQFCFTQL